MPDLICPLMNLPVEPALFSGLRAIDIDIRRCHPWEQKPLDDFIRGEFGQGWADEAKVAFSHQPVTCFVAYTAVNEVAGFACYECTRKNYFGPAGVAESMRGQGIGKALTLLCLYGLRELGYNYAIIGGAGPVEFYRKAFGAQPIPFGEDAAIYKKKTDPLADLFENHP